MAVPYIVEFTPTCIAFLSKQASHLVEYLTLSIENSLVADC